MAIYNTKVAEFFILFDRNVGGNIGWSDSERWEQTFKRELAQLIKNHGWTVVKGLVVAALL